MKYLNKYLISILLFLAASSFVTFSCSPIEIFQKPSSIELHNNNIDKISLLTYNIEAISAKEDDQVDNFLRFINSGKYDFVLLQELFSESTRSDLVEGLDSSHYRTIVSRIDFLSFPEFLFQDSGLFLMSKYPIVNLSDIEFDNGIKNCDGVIFKVLEKEWSRTYDFLANKSVMGALFQISQNDKVFLFTTHLQALGTAENKEFQISQIYNFITESVDSSFSNGLIKKDENLTVILAGDFNIDAYNNTWSENRVRHPKLLSLLGNPRDLHMEFNGEKREYTWNFKSNSYPRRFDYIFTYDSLNGYNLQKISVNEMEVIDVQDDNNKSISDHRGISAKLKFGK